nr:MAG: hypothetical protein 2 [Guangxi sediment mymona-like virus 1]
MAATVITADKSAFWNDDTANITGVRLKTTVPQIEPTPLKMPYFTGGHETLVFIALQIAKTHSKEVALQGMASAVGILFKTTRDLTGGGGSLQSLSGLDESGTKAEDRDETEVLGPEWETGETVTAGELVKYLGDADEIGAYFGVLFLAGIKKRTDRNRDAFNKNRIPNVKSTVNKDLVIFTDASMFLSDAVLDTVQAAFNSFMANRMYLVRETVQLSAGTYVGPALAFQNMFVLLEDAGMGSLRVIKEAILKYPWIKAQFPELMSELRAADQGQKAIRRVAEGERPYCKAIYGNRFVPVAQTEIANLLGVCKMVMAFTVDTYKNFEGGSVSEVQNEKIRARMEEEGIYTPQEGEQE